MIQILILASGKPKHAMHHIIEKAADAATLITSRFAGQIECLADNATLPEKTAIKPGPIS